MAMKRKQTARGRKQARARVAGGQRYEVSYEVRRTGRSAALEPPPPTWREALLDPEVLFLELGALHLGHHPPRCRPTTRCTPPVVAELCLGTSTKYAPYFASSKRFSASILANASAHFSSRRSAPLGSACVFLPSVM
jgi:hypothetical protein